MSPDDHESQDEMQQMEAMAARMRRHLSPTQADESVRRALQMCWRMLPPAKQNVVEVEVEFRRLVDRALKDMHEDAERFGF